MGTTSDPRDNLLLAGLSGEECARVAPWLVRLSVPAGLVLHESGAPYTYAWFPSTAMLSVQYPFLDGRSAQSAMVGHEGMIGVPILLGGRSAPSRDVVYGAGEVFRLPAAILRDEFSRGGSWMALLLRHLQALIAQMTVTVACNRYHSVEQQLCRWLLLCVDRLGSSQLEMTQELLAQAIGVRRETVTEAALKLQALGVIDYARGHITVLDRRGLQHRACECHGVVMREYARLLPAQVPSAPKVMSTA